MCVCVCVRLAYITHNVLAPLMTLPSEVGQKLGQKAPDRVSGGVWTTAGGGRKIAGGQRLKIHPRSVSLILIYCSGPALFC